MNFIYLLGLGLLSAVVGVDTEVFLCGLTAFEVAVVLLTAIVPERFCRFGDDSFWFWIGPTDWERPIIKNIRLVFYIYKKNDDYKINSVFVIKNK